MTRPVLHREGDLHNDVHGVDAYDYVLPPELIAQTPLTRRDASRLLIVDRDKGSIADGTVADLPARLVAGDLLVFNDTRVIKARTFAQRSDTDGHVELLIVRIEDGAVLALLRARGRLVPGIRIRSVTFPAGEDLELVLLRDEGAGLWRLETGLPAPELLRWLDRFGRVPLPPYIRRERGEDSRDAEDESRYQTLLAAHPGAVAAPTAGLHFSEELLARLEASGVRRACVTLHVGPGTFRPVTATDIRDHVMHSERYEVAPECVEAIARARAAGRRVVAVGTTVVRSLESAARDGTLRAASGETSLFLHPPHRFSTIDALFTNFHAPRSTLLMLTAAFAGRELILRAYEHAIASRYRLLSYGDAMLIL